MAFFSNFFNKRKTIPEDPKPSTVAKRLSHAKPAIFFAILTYVGLIVADPATSPFYAIESVLQFVGHSYILLTMLVVLAVAVSISIGYAAIGLRFNKGEGGTGLVFEWLGSHPAMIAAASLLLDFILTDAITMAAAVAALVSVGIELNRYILAAVIFVVVGVLLRLGDKGRTIFAVMSFGFMALLLITTFTPVLPNAAQITHELANGQAEHIAEHSGLQGFALISLIVLGAVRGFALLTGFEASVAALSHEEEKPKYARIAMGVGTIIVVLLFTGVVTLNISTVTQSLKLQPSHENTLFSLWTRSKLNPGTTLSMLTLFSIGILLSGSASGATAGGGMVHVLVKANILPKSFTHIDNEHNDYKGMLIVHALAGIILLIFAADEQRIVAYYAVSVLIGFSLSLMAALRFAMKSKTYYLLTAIPGVFMVIVALLVNLTRIEAITIMIIAFILGDNLHQRWISGGKKAIDFSH